MGINSEPGALAAGDLEHKRDRAPHEEEQPCGALAWQQGDTLDAMTQQALCLPGGSEGGGGHPQPLHAVCACVTVLQRVHNSFCPLRWSGWLVMLADRSGKARSAGSKTPEQLAVCSLAEMMPVHTS